MRETEWHYRDGVGFRIDRHGDVEIGHPIDAGGYYLSPRDLRDVLRVLGVLPGPDKPAERTPDASARVRSSWLQSAGTDDDERSRIAMHATTARLQRAARERAAERAQQALRARTGPRYFRDRHRDVWITHPNGGDRMRLYRMRSGDMVTVHEWSAREWVMRQYGPLTDVTDRERIRTRTGRYRVDSPPLTQTHRPVTVVRFRDRRGREWVRHTTDPDRLCPVFLDGRTGTHGFRYESVNRAFGPLTAVATADREAFDALRVRVQNDMERYARRLGGFNV